MKKQNTLYFRTLLLQGGLPLLHISENQSNYKNFLIAVLEEQPESIEDFMYNSSITNLLPNSSQNEVIYDCCFDIVRSILNEDDKYDDLISQNEIIKEITKTLKNRKKTLIKKQRISKPRNYWLLDKIDKKCSISLSIGLANSFSIEGLENILGFEISGQEYQLFIDNILICVFRKMLNNKFKTDWFQSDNIQWDSENILPECYVVIDSVKKVEILDFIQTLPDLTNPTLWVKYTDNSWRLVKGNNASTKFASVLHPLEWTSSKQSELISVYSFEMLWLEFEGEIQLSLNDRSLKYLSGVESFEWIIQSQKPNWMIKSSMPVIVKKPNIFVYDKNNEKVSKNKFKIWYKLNHTELWTEESEFNFTLGLIDIKIQKDDIIVYDSLFNIESFVIEYIDTSLTNAAFKLINKRDLKFSLYDSPIIDSQLNDCIYYLKVDTSKFKIPSSLDCSVGNDGQKKLRFKIVSPFQATLITDGSGRIVSPKTEISFSKMYGLRILSASEDVTVCMKNILKPHVSISKKIKSSPHPLISFKAEIEKLFYLNKMMDNSNKVTVDLIESKSSSSYNISMFSHYLNVDDSVSNNFRCLPDENIDLYVIPLNCDSSNIEQIKLNKNELSYSIPDHAFDVSDQFIIFSSNEINEIQLKPKWVSFSDDKFDFSLEDFHSKLLDSSFEDDVWCQFLAYFNICINNDFPFSAIEHLRVLTMSSTIAARSFFFLGSNQLEPEEFIRKYVPLLEIDLGFCFYWIHRQDWDFAISAITDFYIKKFNKDNFNDFCVLLTDYMTQNELNEVMDFIHSKPIETCRVLKPEIRDVRSRLGSRVLAELPRKSPRLVNDYNISINDNLPIRLILQAPISIAESIMGIQGEYTIWGKNKHLEDIRRNIQYAQSINPEFYKRLILHVLSNTK